MQLYTKSVPKKKGVFLGFIVGSIDCLLLRRNDLFLWKMPEFFNFPTEFRAKDLKKNLHFCG